MALAGAIVGGIATILVTALGITYWKVVPDKTKTLPSLLKAPAKHRVAYPEGFWHPAESRQLPSEDGTTFLAVLGPKDGPKVILVHGLLACWAAMPHFVHNLISKGYNVVLYDTYGRGYSEAPAKPYSHELYVRQLEGVMKEVGWSKANIVGYSLGGAISTAFAAKNPSMVEKLILIAPAGLPDKLPPLGAFISVPIIGSLFIHGLGRFILKKRAEEEAKECPEMEHCANVTKMNILHHPGVIRAIESTIKEGPIRNMAPFYEKNGKHFKNRILCIWGTADTVVSYKDDMPKFKQFNPEAKIVELPDRDHAIVPKYPDLIANHVHDFLKVKKKKKPGNGVGAAVIKQENKTITFVVKKVGAQCTCDMAEYYGLIWGIRELARIKKGNGLKDIHLEIKGDSQLVINQLTGDSKVSPQQRTLQRSNAVARHLLGLLSSTAFGLVDPLLNAEADALCKRYFVPPRSDLQVFYPSVYMAQEAKVCGLTTLCFTDIGASYRLPWYIEEFLMSLPNVCPHIDALANLLDVYGTRPSTLQGKVTMPILGRLKVPLPLEWTELGVVYKCNAAICFVIVSLPVPFHFGSGGMDPYRSRRDIDNPNLEWKKERFPEEYRSHPWWLSETLFSPHIL
ncbi:hypothetical protein HDU97_002906 [Phlyctochytrium planicorne]|nr:hypothetical protein HDU97_002906 [Phlyctochytrium planicorne]